MGPGQVKDLGPEMYIYLPEVTEREVNKDPYDSNNLELEVRSNLEVQSLGEIFSSETTYWFIRIREDLIITYFRV